jgi:hypothetical protein
MTKISNYNVAAELHIKINDLQSKLNHEYHHKADFSLYRKTNTVLNSGLEDVHSIIREARGG